MRDQTDGTCEQVKGEGDGSKDVPCREDSTKFSWLCGFTSFYEKCKRCLRSKAATHQSEAWKHTTLAEPCLEHDGSHSEELLKCELYLPK